MRLRLAAALVFFAALAAHAHADDLRRYGVVFLHGKGGWAGSFDGGIVSSLRSEGARAVAPEMPWSFGRKYGATYEQAMTEIDQAVAHLREQGAERIVVIGHSLGANAAIGYAARRPVAAVVAMAPGHLPETVEMRGRTASAIEEAKRLVANGEGHVPRRFPDLVQGIPIGATATPVVYLSMFSPDGPAVIPNNAAAMPPVPFLWVVGRLDPIHGRGRDYAFSRGARHPKSRYLEVFADHVLTPLVARLDVVNWIKSL
ncbi:MAG: esterase/lipase family protein [Pseudorhodoplanes sp.]